MSELSLISLVYLFRFIEIAIHVATVELVNLAPITKAAAVTFRLMRQPETLAIFLTR
jgi:hypothetical protein